MNTKRKEALIIIAVLMAVISVAGIIAVFSNIEHPSLTISNVQFTQKWFNATIGFSNLTESGLRITSVQVENWTKEVNTTFYNGDSLTISVPHNGTFAHIPTYIVLGDATGGSWIIDVPVQSK